MFWRALHCKVYLNVQFGKYVVQLYIKLSVKNICRCVTQYFDEFRIVLYWLGTLFVEVGIVFTFWTCLICTNWFPWRFYFQHVTVAFLEILKMVGERDMHLRIQIKLNTTAMMGSSSRDRATGFVSLLGSGVIQYHHVNVRIKKNIRGVFRK